MRQTILNHVTFGRFTATLPDILGSVDIGMRLVSLRATPKVRLITAVALPTVATRGARPAGVARIANSEHPLRALIERIGIHPLGDSPHGHLSGHTKALRDLVVDPLVERQLSEGFGMPRLLANAIAGPIGSLEARAQSVRVGSFDLDCDGQSRNTSYRTRPRPGIRS
jgi:hypothetical protein